MNLSLFCVILFFGSIVVVQCHIRRNHSLAELSRPAAVVKKIHHASFTKTHFEEDCPPGTCDAGCTCCHTEQGWGCCHYENAVCCSDLQHCCPSGYTCDLVHNMCRKGY